MVGVGLLGRWKSICMPQGVYPGVWKCISYLLPTMVARSIFRDQYLVLHALNACSVGKGLTKWIGASKLNVSVEHVTNSRHAPTVSDLPSNPRDSGFGGSVGRTLRP